MKEWGFDSGDRSLSQMLRKMRLMHSFLRGARGDRSYPSSIDAHLTFNFAQLLTLSLMLVNIQNDRASG
jgi:hypothetical protein